MSEERLQEIKDSIEFQHTLAKAKGCDNALLFTNEEEELVEEIERLNNIINTILDFNFFKEECPLSFDYQEECNEEKAKNVFYYKDDYCEKNCNDEYKKCWLKYFARLQELKESGKE